jgi:hypothetical protein
MTYRTKTPPWPYYIEEETKVVWLKADSWTTACAAPHLVKRYFGPDYTHMLATIEKINELKLKSGRGPTIPR